ncbi:MAG: LTA synthase family protein, partial [Lachnospiraceae bacterium]|nr:LTA synthase family protein [Lachnospiraceae bacterium]
YVHDWEATLGTQKLGFFTSAGMDIKEILFGREGDDLEEVLLTGRPVTPFVQEEVTPVPSVPGDEMGSGEITVEITPTAVPTPPVFHELYDFAKLAEQESNKEIKTLHTYFSGLSPEKENEYTGKFAGYNLILLTAEAFSPLAVDKELTPTLYKLTHSGFVFENFYTPLWYTSTSDGEYVACTGLLPDGANSMTRSAKNDMRFAFGNQFAAIGYQTLAYHNHKYSYYSRDKSHPNLGYTYKGIGNGLLLPSTCWPRSDLEMMEVTVPEYIDREPFHIYYMTVSGHMEYTFTDNTMANRNRGVVEDLPYSEPAKAYLACNYELEKALTYLLERLEAEGVAEHTVIALSADHYPYGLEKQYIDELAGHEVEENFELYKNYFILWSAGMEEKITIEKYCSGLDIAPTLANLFGLPYDSRLYAGSDILSDQEGLVIFDNKSFITDRVAYNAVTGTATPLNGATVTEEYLEGKKREVKQKFAMSKGILVNDYFSYLPK